MDFKNTLSWPDKMKVQFEVGDHTHEGEVWNDGKAVYLLHNSNHAFGFNPPTTRGYKRSWKIGDSNAAVGQRYDFSYWEASPTGQYRFANLRPASPTPATCSTVTEPEVAPRVFNRRLLLVSSVKTKKEGGKQHHRMARLD